VTTTFLDLKWGLVADPGDPPEAGWLRYSAPRDYPSPALVAAAGALAARGEPVAFRHLSIDDALAAAGELAAGARIVIAAPPLHRRAAGDVRRALIERGAAEGAISLLDPWAPAVELAAGAGAGADGAALAREASCLGEVDVAPYRDPVHPWACAPAAARSGAGGEAWLQAAIASFAPADRALLERPLWQAWERELFLNDPRAVMDLDRLRALARAVKQALHRHSTMLKLHVRVWPSAIDRRLVDHLTLLPIGSLDLLAGSLEGAGGALAGACAPAVIEQALATLRDGGMSHLTAISLVLALPGQTPQDCLESIKRAISLAVAARVRRIRFAFWLGDAAPCPESAEHQHELFLAAHPDWHLIEYAGIGDFLALMRQVARGVMLVGPELAPGWELPRVEDVAV
jgi:hypothetical protein